MAVHPTQAKFREQVYEIVREIPPGRVMTYGDIAHLLPPPSGMRPESYQAVGPRWVGYAMAECPADLPWHRVVNARGKISPRSESDWRIQLHLLQMEGVEFDPNQRLDLTRYRWRPGGSDVSRKADENES